MAASRLCDTWLADEMKRKILLEISVETVEGALAAQRAGADRVEFCGNLSVGGITPSTEQLRAVREKVKLPIYSMVRPRGGDFFYSDSEFESMKRDIATAKVSAMDGVVFGLLTHTGNVDAERTKELVELSGPLPVTFHRAFDECINLPQALEDVIATGAARLLTSGGMPSAAEGVDTLTSLVAQAKGRIIILPGAGITPSNLMQIAKKTGGSEFHSGLSASLPRPYSSYDKFESEIRKMVEALATL